MAKYVFTGTITVYDVRSKQDAIDQLQIMLNDYEDMNPDNKDCIEFIQVLKKIIVCILELLIVLE